MFPETTFEISAEAMHSSVVIAPKVFAHAAGSNRQVYDAHDCRHGMSSKTTTRIATTVMLT